MATPYRVREGMEEDLNELHRLMQESAINGTKDVAAFAPSVETLRTYGFAEPRYFHFLVTENLNDQGNGACEVSSLIGYLIFCKSFSTEVGKILILKDLYVTPEYRKKGAAKEMWKSILKFAVMEEFGRVQWSVKNTDSELLEYSESYGLTNLMQNEGWYIFNMNKTEIKCVK